MYLYFINDNILKKIFLNNKTAVFGITNNIIHQKL